MSALTRHVRMEGSPYRDSRERQKDKGNGRDDSYSCRIVDSGSREIEDPIVLLLSDALVVEI
jgi:hypothetical protein